MSKNIKKSKEKNKIFKLARKIVELNQQAFLMIEPVVREVMASGIQDLDYLERMIEPQF